MGLPVPIGTETEKRKKAPIIYLRGGFRQSQGHGFSGRGLISVLASPCGRVLQATG